MCTEVGPWASGPKPDPGAAFALQQHGRPSCPCWQPHADMELESSPLPYSPHAASPCEVGCGVCLCLTVTPGRGLREEAITELARTAMVSGHVVHSEEFIFTLVFQKIEVTVASLLNPPPPPTPPPWG